MAHRSEVVDRIEVEEGILYMTRPGYYFGYGLESDIEAFETIVGRPVVAELGVHALVCN